jgi:hypothetical protein
MGGKRARISTPEPQIFRTLTPSELTSNLTVLGEVELEGTSDGLHDLGLGSGTDTGHGKTDVDGRSDTLEEELGLQEDLTVCGVNDQETREHRTRRTWVRSERAYQ